MTRRAVDHAIEATGARLFGLFEWRPLTLDVITRGPLSQIGREALQAAIPVAVAINFHDDWRSPLSARRSPLAELQRRIDAARADAQTNASAA